MCLADCEAVVCDHILSLIIIIIITAVIDV
jgi:hypothetical protein